MESSEVNSIYCHLTIPVHGSFYLLRRKIATSMPNHIEELVEAARKFGVGEKCLAGARPCERSLLRSMAAYQVTAAALRFI